MRTEVINRQKAPGASRGLRRGTGRPAGAEGAPIGVFDSGVGGLTVLRELQRQMPHEDLVYLGDTARVPYGTKSPATVIRFALEDAEFLVRQGVKAIVVACNSVSAWALAALEGRFPVPIFGVIDPGVTAALARTRTGRIAVIGTQATIRSDAYGRALRLRQDQVQVFSRACPLLVPLVEEGWLRHPVTRAVLREYLEPLLEHGIDTLILGCTHYPLLKPAIREISGAQISLIDSAQSCAHFVRVELERKQRLQRGRRRPGAIQLFVTDEVDQIGKLACQFFKQPLEKPCRVVVDG